MAHIALPPLLAAVASDDDDPPPEADGLGAGPIVEQQIPDFGGTLALPANMRKTNFEIRSYDSNSGA